jgi:lipopolysaccharide export system permease protein
MSLTDRYLLRRTMGLLVGLAILALGLLLMARLIRLTTLLSGAENALLYGARLLASLVPHYLELALPGALLVAVIISVDRFSRSGEIVALMSTGMSLYRIARPFVMMGFAVMLLSLFLLGFLQPQSRYVYRQIVFELQEGSIITAFQQQKFLQFEGRTIWTSSVDDAGRSLGRTFIIESAPDGSHRFLTGETGLLHFDETGRWVISLRDAMIGQVPTAFDHPAGNRVKIANVDWQLPATDGEFRLRGSDERELTLPELITGSYRDSAYDIDPLIADASMHDRLVRAMLPLVLPLLGVVLGLNLGRTAKAGGPFLGIIALLVVQKLLEFGLAQAERGVVPAWGGSWPVLILLIALSIWLFRQTARGRPLLPHLAWSLRRQARTMAGSAS